MLCLGCRYEMADEATVCWNCGAPTGASAKADPGRWEKCGIVHWHRPLSDVLMVEHRFVAKAIGPSGQYRVAESTTWFESGSMLNPQSKKPAAALRCLTGVLQQDGWQYIERGMQWYEGHFGRRMPD